MPRRHFSQSRTFSVLLAGPLGIASRALSRIPLATLRRWVEHTARWHAALPTERRATIRDNLARCFPEDAPLQRNARIVATFRHLHCLVAETGISWHFDAARATALFETIDGHELLEQPGPLIVLQPHFGNWELLPLAIRGTRPVGALFAPAKVGAIDEISHRARTRWGTAVYPSSTRGLLGLRRALAAGSAIVILPDQVPPPPAGIDAPFFGTPARTMTLVHQLVRHTRAHVVFGWVERTSSGFRAGFKSAPDSLYGADALASATAMNDCVEAIVRRDPGQYQWGYKRFRTPRDKRRERSGG